MIQLRRVQEAANGTFVPRERTAMLTEQSITQLRDSALATLEALEKAYPDAVTIEYVKSYVGRRQSD